MGEQGRKYAQMAQTPLPPSRHPASGLRLCAPAHERQPPGLPNAQLPAPPGPPMVQTATEGATISLQNTTDLLAGHAVVERGQGVVRPASGAATKTSP